MVRGHRARTTPASDPVRLGRTSTRVDQTRLFIGRRPVSRCRGNPRLCRHDIAIQPDDFADGRMHFASRHVVETVARRCIGEESDAMAAMECIDRRRKACGLARKTGKNVIAPAGSDDFAELLRGIAGWPAPLENHVHARRLEPSIQWKNIGADERTYRACPFYNRYNRRTFLLTNWTHARRNTSLPVLKTDKKDPVHWEFQRISCTTGPCER